MYDKRYHTNMKIYLLLKDTTSASGKEQKSFGASAPDGFCYKDIFVIWKG